MEPVIVDAARTPFGRRRGWLSHVHPAELLGLAQRGLLDRNELPADRVEQLIGGCVTQAGEQAGNVTRNAWLHAGLPSPVGCTTIDAQCSSAQQSMHLIAGLIHADAIEVGLACGVESMSRLPLQSNMPGPTGRPKPEGWSIDLPNQFEGADRIAREKGITRAALDEFGLRSQRLAAEAWRAGHLTRQVIPVQPGEFGTPVEGTPEQVCTDQGLRDTDLERLAALDPVLTDGLHTAGTSSQISDGASAALLTSKAAAQRLGLRPRARIVSQALVGGDPHFHLDGPIQATERVLKRSGMSLSDIDLVEVNEAFAAVPLSLQRHFELPLDKLNTLGGAIAVGHPVGATGLRLVATVLDELERRDLQRGLVAICAGGAMASATILERI
ncbi:acetyl-CoA acetyltransferase [Enemella dayhoffiae]|uniref:Acetyl-CoA acetyltransferase n=1 Tax=Enemella dayhoffiae TaxID=2016507 RepID=A0A255GL59_9ACTN|nr:steroid 3-ketoacyl-CoA thiolase [Enemella dayhoffiae]OYO16550.1 acetyl-CoA acetyltransferase [Enemella dayhoffiae]